MSKDHREYFNNLAPVWHERMPPSPDFKHYLVRFGIRSGDRVLDIGCGTGRMTGFISELAGPSGMVVAQDIAEQMVNEAHQRLIQHHCHFLCDDALQLAQKNDCYDKVLCFSAFPHFADKRQALSEIARVLKPDGKLLILHTKSSREMNAFHQSLDFPVKNDALPDLDELRQLIQSLSLREIRLKEQTDLYWAEMKKIS